MFKVLVKLRNFNRLGRRMGLKIIPCSRGVVNADSANKCTGSSYPKWAVGSKI
jgi:hypothetical protein